MRVLFMSPGRLDGPTVGVPDRSEPGGCIRARRDVWMGGARQPPIGTCHLVAVRIGGETENCPGCPQARIDARIDAHCAALLRTTMTRSATGNRVDLALD